MKIKNVVCRESKKGDVNTYIIEFHFTERERPYRLYVNNFTDIGGLKEQLRGLARIIPPYKESESTDE